jgi:hypothetical protein
MALTPNVKDRLIDKFISIQQWAWRGQVLTQAGRFDKVEWTGKHIESVLAELETIIEGLRRQDGVH